MFKILQSSIPGVQVLIPEIHIDERGEFMEFFNKREFMDLNIPSYFTQGNHSISSKRVVRGLHYQWSPMSGKLMRVTSGSAFIAAVDIRIDSLTLGKHVGVYLKNYEMLYVPEGFATGFCALEDNTGMQYLMTAEYSKETQGTILWNDPVLNINWPSNIHGEGSAIVSQKDKEAQTFTEWLKSKQLYAHSI